MTPEDRLRRLLQDHDDDTPLAGDGLREIRERLAARRSWRSRVLVPAAALSGVVVIAAAAVIGTAATNDGDLRPEPEQRATTAPSPSSTACTAGLCIEPRPTPSRAVSEVTTSDDGLPVWPFTTDAQAAEWLAAKGSRTWAADPVQVAQHLMDDFLKLPGTKAVGTAGRRGGAVSVVVKVGDRVVSTVQLEQVGRTAGGPWSVTGAVSEDVGVTSPAPGAAVESPLRVTGRVTGYDQSVHVQLLSSSGAQVADGYAMAGAEQPWSQPLRWTSTWTIGAVVASLRDGKGDLHAFDLTPVRRSSAGLTGVPAGSRLVAIQDGHVVAADAVTGETVRQLSYPPDDATDSDPDRGGEDGVVWVRRRGDDCTSMIIRAGLTNGPAGITVDAKPRFRRLPSLSAGGRSLAWVERECTDGAAESVVVRGPDAQLSTVATATSAVTTVDVRDDGTLLVGLADAVVVLPEGAQAFDRGRRLTARAGCTLHAPAWDGAVATAWERCPDGQRLTRFDGRGAPVSAGPPVDTDLGVRDMSISEGLVLVVLDDASPARLSGDRLIAVPQERRLFDASW